MARYAEGTSVAAERSQVELERLLARYGADQFARGWAGEVVVVAFRIGGRQVRMGLPMPESDDPTITRTPSGKRRTEIQIQDGYDAEVRRRWRSLVAVVKAKLVAVTDGISTIEREFLADVVLPDGTTLGEWAGPQIEKMYATAVMPPMLRMLEAGS